MVEGSGRRRWLTEMAVARATVGAVLVWFLAGVFGAAADHDLLLLMDLTVLGGWAAFAFSWDTSGYPGPSGPPGAADR